MRPGQPDELPDHRRHTPRYGRQWPAHLSAVHNPDRAPRESHEHDRHRPREGQRSAPLRLHRIRGRFQRLGTGRAGKRHIGRRTESEVPIHITGSTGGSPSVCGTPLSSPRRRGVPRRPRPRLVCTGLWLHVPRTEQGGSITRAAEPRAANPPFKLPVRYKTRSRAWRLIITG